MNVFEEVKAIFRDVFDDEEMEVTLEMTARDYDDWDSMAQIQLIVAAERRFHIKFTTEEMKNLKNVGDFVQRIEEKRR
nr:acyl carrier protein [uncultured Acetatifactor sp.]